MRKLLLKLILVFANCFTVFNSSYALDYFQVWENWNILLEKFKEFINEVNLISKASWLNENITQFRYDEILSANRLNEIVTVVNNVSWKIKTLQTNYDTLLNEKNILQNNYNILSAEKDVMKTKIDNAWNIWKYEWLVYDDWSMSRSEGRSDCEEQPDYYISPSPAKWPLEHPDKWWYYCYKARSDWKKWSKYKYNWIYIWKIINSDGLNRY